MIGEQGFKQNHWNAFVKLNTVHNNEYFDVLHNGLRFKQYVGVIQVDGLLVHIHPKADKEDSNDGKIACNEENFWQIINSQAAGAG